MTFQTLIGVPEPEEQNAIVGRIESSARAIAIESSEVGKLHQLKSVLMTDLLTGRVRVPATVALPSASANGASSNQPGATPQVAERKPGKG